MSALVDSTAAVVAQTPRHPTKVKSTTRISDRIVPTVTPVAPDRANGAATRSGIAVGGSVGVTPNAKSPGANAATAADSGESVYDRLKNFLLPKCVTPGAREMQPVESFVANAIASRHTSDDNPAHDKAYAAILDALRRPADPEMLRRILLAFRTAGNGTTMIQLTGSAHTHAQLIHLLFRLNSFDPPAYKKPPTQDMLKPFETYSLADAHMNVLLALVSAQSTNVIPALRYGWRMLISRDGNAPNSLVDRIHAFLASVMRLVPRARSDMFSVMSSTCPFWAADQSKIIWFYRQCLSVLRYHPSIETQVLELIIDKSLEMDVNIQIKDTGEASVDDKAKGNDNGDDAAFDLDLGTGDEAGAKKQLQSSKTAGIDVDELSDKLDCLLYILLKYVDDKVKDEADARQIYQDIEPIFESSILTTHKSKFVQFCVFHLCGLEIAALQKRIQDPDELAQSCTLDRDFASKLLEIIIDPYRATTTRQSGACYLASFISRANYVTSDTVCEAVAALLRWAEAYIRSIEDTYIHATDSREQSKFHSLFYTVCQAAFYIMSFRGKDAILYHRRVMEQQATPTGDEQHQRQHHQEEEYEADMNIAGKRWTVICQHPLQPLKFCLESVRSEFLHVAHVFELVDTQVLKQLVKDARNLSTGRVGRKSASRISTAGTLARRRQTGGVGGLGQGSNPLNSFFPFDPLLLRRSHGYVEPVYNYWQGPLDDDDFEEDMADTDTDNGVHIEAGGVTSEHDNDDDDDDDDDDEDDDEEEEGDEDSDDEDGDRSEYNDDESFVQSCDSVGTRPMSFGSAAPTEFPHIMHTPQRAIIDKDTLRNIWTDAVKRPRSHSIHSNGSW